MSLDSVALQVEFENYFNAEIPDLEAEKIHTVQDAVDAFSRKKNIADNQKTLQSTTINRLQKAIHQIGLTTNPIAGSDLVIKYIPDKSNSVWSDLSSIINLKIPTPENPEENFISKFLGRPKFDYSKLTFSELADAISAFNYESLIDRDKIKSKHEIYIAIMGLTSDKLGVPIYIIKPDKTFTDDFGID